MGAVCPLPHRLSAFPLRATREGGTRPRPRLPRPLRRRHCHQLFARLLLQVRVQWNALGLTARLLDDIGVWNPGAQRMDTLKPNCPANWVCTGSGLPIIKFQIRERGTGEDSLGGLEIVRGPGYQRTTVTGKEGEVVCKN